jgi:tetratricopeptide (TPR) repeat protein
MAIQVRESTIEEIKAKLSGMNTALNKIMYLESALAISGFSYDIKRFLWAELAELYEERKMFDKAGKAMSNKAGVEVVIRDKMNSYIVAADLFSRAGRVDDADSMFVRALRDVDAESKLKIKLARKNIYSVAAEDLEKKGKKASAVKFYEKLIKMKINEDEKSAIRAKLISTYNALGMFREAKLLGE